MTLEPRTRIDRVLSGLFGELADARTPAYLEAAIERASSRHQRPAWTFPERWLPMEITTTEVPVARPPWRALGILALIGILIAGALAVYVGSRPTPPPVPPFGLAGNGQVALAREGDIVLADPVTGATTVVTSGPEADRAPVVSGAGTHIAFERRDGGRGLLFVVGADGSGLTQITPEPLMDLQGWSFSPDGSSVVALALRDGRPQILIAAADGSEPPRFFDVGATTDDGPPAYRPPDGREILFVGQRAGQATRGAYALDPSTSDVRVIVAPTAHGDVYGADWSPDGMRIAYGVHDPSAATISTRTHVVSADGSGDVAVDRHPDAIADGLPRWSNDGSRLVISRFLSETDVRSVVVPVDGSGLGVEIDCPPGVAGGDCSADWRFAPDDTQLFGKSDEGVLQHLLADPTTGAVTEAPWTGNGDPSWQRVAPSD